jgi:hypothetical protein
MSFDLNRRLYPGGGKSWDERLFRGHSGKARVLSSLVMLSLVMLSLLEVILALCLLLMMLFLLLSLKQSSLVVHLTVVFARMIVKRVESSSSFA